MKKYSILFAICCMIFVPAKAQISGLMGKNSAISVAAHFQPIRRIPYSYDVTTFANNERNSLKFMPHIQASYEKAFNRQQSFIIQTRYLGDLAFPSLTMYRVDPRTNSEEIFVTTANISIAQVGLEYATYKKRNWTLAPIGKCIRWGIHFNAMFYDFESTRDVIAISEKGTYIFPSFSAQYNDRIPLNKNLSFNYGFGVDVPIGFLNFRFVGVYGLNEVMFRNFLFSRLFNVGLSYHL